MEDFKKNLLSNKDVVDEINRHRWLESEKSGRDIGFDQAAEDWLKRFSSAWMQYHMPEKLKEQPSTQDKAQKNDSNDSRKSTRRARSYY